MYTQYQLALNICNSLHSFGTITKASKFTWIQYYQPNLQSLLDFTVFPRMSFFWSRIPHHIICHVSLSLCQSVMVPSYFSIPQDLCTFEKSWSAMLYCVPHFWITYVLSRLGWGSCLFGSYTTKAMLCPSQSIISGGTRCCSVLCEWCLPWAFGKGTVTVSSL